MNHSIDNQYKYGVVYNLDGQIVGFNLSPDLCIYLTDKEIEQVLEEYAKQKQDSKRDTWSIKDVADTLAKHRLIAEQEPCEMTNSDEIKSIIIKSLESADNYLISDVYNQIVSCCDCPYWHDCLNEHECEVYIFNKLEDKNDCKRTDC